MLGPDFLIIGAMKCGTSTLQAQLAAQAGVFMTTPKEPNFFSDDDVYSRGRDWYEGLFVKASSEDLKGEASTHYTKLPTYPDTLARMRQMLEQPKLIYMIRNPVERAVSQYVHEWSKGSISSGIEDAFAQDNSFVDYGRYGMQITPFAETYGVKSIFLTSLELVKTDPSGELARIGTFLQTTSTLHWKEEIKAQNVSKERFRHLPFHKLIIANPVARAVRHTLVPKSLRKRVKQMRTLGERPQLPEALRHALENIYLQDRMDLESLFPDHPALQVCYPFAF